MSKKSKIILLILIVGFLLSLPVVPVSVVPEVSIRAVDTNKKPVAGVVIYQEWQHWTYESEAHRDESVADENGFAAFSAKGIWVSPLRMLFGLFGEYVLGGIAIHADSGPSVGFGAKDYLSDNKWCYPESKCQGRETSKEVVIKERVK